jgi:hypothetical protein
MAPYSGPNLVESIRLLLEGQLPGALGIGLPKAYFRADPDGLKLVALHGGSGFGVQADLAEPFSDGAVLAHEPTALAIGSALIKRWDTKAFGEPFLKGEAVHVHICPPSDAMPQFRQKLQREMLLTLGKTEELASRWELVCDDLKRLQRLFEIMDSGGGELLGLSVTQRARKRY